MKKHPSYRKGFNLIEVMFAMGVLGVFTAGMLKLYVDISTMNAAVDAKTAAYVALINKVEEMRNSNFADLATNYAAGGTPGNTFSLSPTNGIGVITVLPDSSTHAEFTIQLFWRDKTGRYVGEDRDMDGTLDAGGDAMLSSEAIAYAQHDAYRYTEEMLGIDWMNEMEASFGFLTLMDTLISDSITNSAGATIDESETESVSVTLESDLYAFLIGPDWKADEGKSSELSRAVRESTYTYMRDTIGSLPPSENEDENSNGILDTPETFGGMHMMDI